MLLSVLSTGRGRVSLSPVSFQVNKPKFVFNTPELATDMDLYIISKVPFKKEFTDRCERGFKNFIPHCLLPKIFLYLIISWWGYHSSGHFLAAVRS